MKVRQTLVKQAHEHLSVRQKVVLLSVNRASLFYKAKPVGEDTVTLMNEIQDLYARHPFMGYRRITAMLRQQGFLINPKRILRLMRKMGLQAVYPKRNLSKRLQQDKVYPYLLRAHPPQKPNDAWCIDITYIKTAVGFVYLVALIDVVSRRVMGFDVSIFLETASSLRALDMALALGVKPVIINSDQGCQFTSQEWISALQANGIAVSMDGVGRCLDNIAIERFWRSLKYEEVYLKTYESVAEAKVALGQYINWYNTKRPHQSLNYRTPMAVYQEMQVLLLGETIGSIGSEEGFSLRLPTEPYVRDRIRLLMLNEPISCVQTNVAVYPAIW